MTKTEIEKRQKAVAAAVGSMRAEGQKPSARTLKWAKDYAVGKVTINEFRNQALKEAKTAIR